MTWRTAIGGKLISSAGPRLLVSVGSRAEAAQAMAGGAEILDVKDPSRGSLGMADLQVIDEIARFVGTCPTEGAAASGESPPFSVALGEMNDWVDRGVVPALPPQVTFAKLGLSERDQSENWPAHWLQLRQAFDARRGTPLRWVAVAYADAVAARSPSLQSVYSAAVETGCAGLLIDTYEKAGQSLLDHVSPATLGEIARRCHASGLFLAIAGSLSVATLRDLRPVDPDVIAIRTAGCLNSNRAGTIDAARVAGFREELRHVFAPPQLQRAGSHGVEARP